VQFVALLARFVARRFRACGPLPTVTCIDAPNTTLQEPAMAAAFHRLAARATNCQGGLDRHAIWPGKLDATSRAWT
jgi:hypothetical protein